MAACNWSYLFDGEIDPYNGFVRDYQKIFKIVRKYEIATTSKLTTFCQTEAFGKAGLQVKIN